MVSTHRLLRPLSSCVRRCVSSRFCCVFTLFVLVLVGVSFHNTVIHQSSEGFSFNRIVSSLVEPNQNQNSAQNPGPGDSDQLKKREGPTDQNLQEDKYAQPPKGPVDANGCPEKSHLVLLKTQRTGSSSIQNILFRYGQNRSLNFALPRNKFRRFFYPLAFEAQFVEGFSKNLKTKFHILCNHMRFRKSEVSKVMPPDTFYFSILRDPVPMMESMFMYFSRVSESQSLERFVEEKLRNYREPTAYTDHTHNNLVYDFGYDNTVTTEAPDLEERVTKIIAGIEKDFDLILINEYFDESVILLRHALCWSLEDVVSFRLNARSKKSHLTISEKTAENIRRWNVLDWRIYLHFNKTFWDKVEQVVGLEEMKIEVTQLRDLQAQLQETCLKGGGAVLPPRNRKSRLKSFEKDVSFILGYYLKNGLDEDTKIKCRRLITPELTYTQSLFSQQFPKEEDRK